MVNPAAECVQHHNEYNIMMLEADGASGGPPDGDEPYRDRMISNQKESGLIDFSWQQQQQQQQRRCKKGYALR